MASYLLPTFFPVGPPASTAPDLFLKAKGSKSPVDIGDLASTYVFVREIGRGGMGTVIVARHRAAGHFVAIKIASPDKINPEVLARLTREARLMARLQHPNIVKLYDVRPIGGGRVGIVMEYVRGQSLADVINARKKISYATCINILRDVGRGLAHAHGGGVIHLDVKPANVLIEADAGTARLSDFGIAKGAGEVSEVTAAGGVVGTPAYMSPEQIDGLELDGRSDAYALGVLGWQLVSGEQPWAGEQLFKLLYKQKHEPLPSLRELKRDVPEGLLLAIDGALEKDRTMRWARVDDMIEQLDSATPTRANLARRATRSRKAVPTPDADAVIQQSTVPIYRPRVLRNVSDSRNAETLQITESEAEEAAPAAPALAPVAEATPALVEPARVRARPRWLRREFAAGAAVGISVAFLLFKQLAAGNEPAPATTTDTVVVAPGDVDTSARSGATAADSTPTAPVTPPAEPVATPSPLEPRIETVSQAQRARVLVFSNDATKAAAIVDSALAIDPRNGEAYILRARLRIANGDVRAAWTDIELGSHMGYPWEALALSTMLNARQSGNGGARELIDRQLRDALTPRRRLEPDRAVGLATALVMTGDTSTALTMLELAERDPRLPRLLADPLLMPLRSSSRFNRVLRDNTP